MNGDRRKPKSNDEWWVWPSRRRVENAREAKMRSKAKVRVRRRERRAAKMEADS